MEDNTKVGEEEPVTAMNEVEGKKKRGRKKRPIAFGEAIPNACLLNREFRIPLEWIPQEKRL